MSYKTKLKIVGAVERKRERESYILENKNEALLSERKIKNEKGSITLFVLITMLFFMVILIAIYTNQANRIINQKEQIEEIAKQYNAEDIDEVYEELTVGEITLTPSTTEWANGDVIVTVNYGNNLTRNRRLTCTGEVNTDYTVNGTTSIVVKTNEQTITATATDSKGNKVIETLTISNIDKISPTVTFGTNGGNFINNIKSTVTASDTGGSGLNSLEYAWSTSNTTEPTTWTNFTSGTEISKTNCPAGTYYLWTKVTDNAGNIATNKTSAFSVIASITSVTINQTYTKNYVGNSTTFTASVSGSGTLTYQWYYNTSNTAGSGTAGGTSSSYAFSTNTASTYYLSCKVTQKYGNDTVTLTSGTKSIIIAAKPTISISPTSVTMVAGNSTTLTATISGTKDSATYQWYYSTSNTAGSGTAGGTSSSYTFSPSSSTTYYLSCKSTCTYGGSVTITSTTVKVTVQPANYKTVKSNVTTYYNTLASAVSGATSGGGDTGGGTITVLNSLTDTSSVSINKTITINTNGKTVTRNASITTTAGTVTINGTGTIYSNTDYTVLVSTGGNIAISGTPLIKGTGTGINMSAGTLNISGGYIYSLARSPVYYKGSAAITIDGAYLYTPVKDKNALYIGEGSTSVVTIKGASKLGNGSSNTSGTDGSGSGSHCISYGSTGTLTIGGTSYVMGGPYSASTIKKSTSGTVIIQDSARVYTANTDGKNCILIESSGVTVTFNTEGYCYCTAGYVANAGSYAATYNVKKGHFVSRNNKYMFYKSGAAVTTYAGTGTSSRNFSYMNAYNSTTTTTISDCYYYTIGI